MQLQVRGILAALGALVLSTNAAAQSRCDCTNIVGSCSASAAVADSFITVTSNVEQCARVDYFVDGIPFVALVVDGIDRQDRLAGSDVPSVIVQSCQVCLDNAAATTAPELGTGLYSDGEASRLIGVAPDYPAAAAAAGIEGYVELRFTISPMGTVLAPEIVAAEPAGVFEEAALAAVARWRYTRPLGSELPSVTERIDFNLADEIFSLERRANSSPEAVRANEPRRNSNNCVREDTRFDFGSVIGISLMNACGDPLIVYHCVSGTGANRDRWICSNPERTATALASATGSAPVNVSIATPAGDQLFTAAGRLEITRAPNSEYWWLACAVDDTSCHDEGRLWVRSLDRQAASVDPQNRTRVTLARSY